MTYRIPDNVIQELQASVQKLEQHIPAFDEWDDNMMHDICGERLAKPIQTLLITLSQIKIIEGSFGPESANKDKILAAILDELKDLRKACIEEWRDL